MQELLCTYSGWVSLAVISGVLLTFVVLWRGGSIEKVKIPYLFDVQLQHPLSFSGSAFWLLPGGLAILFLVALSGLKITNQCATANDFELPKPDIRYACTPNTDPELRVWADQPRNVPLGVTYPESAAENMANMHREAIESKGIRFVAETMTLEGNFYLDVDRRPYTLRADGRFVCRGLFSQCSSDLEAKARRELYDQDPMPVDLAFPIAYDQGDWQQVNSGAERNDLAMLVSGRSALLVKRTLAKLSNGSEWRWYVEVKTHTCARYVP